MLACTLSFKKDNPSKRDSDRLEHPELTYTTAAHTIKNKAKTNPAPTATPKWPLALWHPLVGE